MKIGLRLNGKAIGVEPRPRPGQIGDAQYPVYADRDVVGSWEELELTPHDGGRFDARFLVADRQLSFTPSGLETRAAGAIGSWELPYATDQPDGSALLYRFNDGSGLVAVLTIEARS
jgi:hypothetical protein